METLQIRWQRLVNEQEETCERCAITETAVEEAVQKLKSSVRGLGIDVVLEKIILDPSTFKDAPLESNRIWIADKPLEDWLSATAGHSQCYGACGDSECRTVIVDGKNYEAIPPELIVKAGLLASAQMLGGGPQEGCSPTSCKPQPTIGCCPSSSVREQ